MDREQKINDQINELYHAMFLKLTKYANTRLRNPDLAVEATQDVFRIACSDPNGLLTSENPRGWLMNVMKRVLWNIQRAEAKQTSLAIKMQSTRVLDAQDNIDGIVNARLACQQVLSKDDYDVINLVIFQQYTLAAAARELGITLEACKKRSQRAKKKLQKYFEK